MLVATAPNPEMAKEIEAELNGYFTDAGTHLIEPWSPAHAISEGAAKCRQLRVRYVTEVVQPTMQDPAVQNANRRLVEVVLRDKQGKDGSPNR